MKKRYLPILIVLMPLNIGPVTAQSPEKEQPFRVGVGLGYTFTGYRDEVESPINRYLTTLIYIIDGNIEKGNFLHFFNINFFIGNPEMTEPYTGYNHAQYISARGYIEYALDYRLWGNRTFPGYIGGAFRTSFHYSGSDDAVVPSSPTGAGSFSLNLHVTQKWIIDRKRILVLSLGTPFFGYTVRPAYAGYDDIWMKYLYESPLKIITLGRITSFHNHWVFFGDLKYHYKYDTLFSPYAGLGFEISQINFPRPRKDIIFWLNVGISFTF